MFGKRSGTDGDPRSMRPPAAPESALPVAAEAPRAAAPTTIASPPLVPAKQSAPPPVESRKSDTYYQVKATIFGALIEAIDLAQLAKLDGESAREEIRDIVNEIKIGRAHV